MVADDDREAAAVSRLALRLNTLISILILTAILIIFLCGATSGNSFITALFIPPMVFLCGTTRVYTFIFNRFKEFRPIAISDIVGSTSGLLLKILLGLPALLTTVWHTIGLPLGTVLGKAASNINYLVRLRRLPLPAAISHDERRNAARKFRNFPLYVMPKDLINSLSFNLPFIWMAIYFDKAEVGLFSLALTCTFRPVNIFNSAFEKLLYPRIAERVRQRRPISSDLSHFFLMVNAVAAPLFIALFVWGDAIFVFFFGGRWSSCGFYLRCMLPWVWATLTSTSMFISNIFRKQRTEFIFYLVLLALRVASVVAGLATHNFRLGIMLFTTSGLAASIALIAWYLKIVKDYERGLLTSRP